MLCESPIKGITFSREIKGSEDTCVCCHQGMFGFTTGGKINLTTHTLTNVLVRYGLFLLLEISSYSIRKLTNFYLQFVLTTVEP